MIVETALMWHDVPVAAQPATRRGNRRTLGAPAPSKALFLCVSRSMAGDAGQSVRAGRVPSSRFSTPASFAAPTVESRPANSSDKTRSSAMAIKPIQTRYQGYKFRSRLEARYAVYFDEMGIHWEYEPQGFVLTNGVCYLPDFYLSSLCAWVEIKPNHDIPYSECQKVARFAHEKEEPCLLVVGTPGKQKMYLLDKDVDPVFCCAVTEEFYLSEFASEDEAKTCFFEWLEEYRLVNFSITPIPCWDYKKIEWKILYEHQPPYIARKVQSAIDKARSARFEFGESGGSA